MEKRRRKVRVFELTPAERVTIARLAAGWTLAGVAAKLYPRRTISLKTVWTYKQRALRKLRARTAKGAAEKQSRDYITRMEWLTPDEEREAAEFRKMLSEKPRPKSA